jgi:selenocysteine lyase/cysteine desulfurase
MGPLSRTAAERAARVVTLQSEDGSLGSSTWQQWRESARHRAARLIGASDGEICFLKNTPEGISTIAAGIDWRRGDNVVLPGCEFPANVFPWMNLASAGVEARVVPAADGIVTPERLSAAIDSRTRLVALSWIQFLSGSRIDLTEVGNLCERRGTWLLVDGIQGVGVSPIDVKASGIHFLATASHKWLLAPMGAGWLYCREDLVDRLKITDVGQSSVRPLDSYLEYRFELKPDARRFEGGVPAYTSIAGLDGALEVLDRVSVSHVRAQVEALCTKLIDGLHAQGCTILTPTEPTRRAGIVTFRHPKKTASAIQQSLAERKIVVVEREGWVRVSPHFYNTLDEVSQLLDAVKT